mgnify:CR=1 FL=1
MHSCEDGKIQRFHDNCLIIIYTQNYTSKCKNENNITK